MRCMETENRGAHESIERYVMAAIVEAREVYGEQKWLVWADHWIAGRDRSFASARLAHAKALQACDRESVSRTQRWQKGDDADFGPIETPAEMAAWAAGLALVTASAVPDLMAVIRRIKFALRARLSRTRAPEGVSARRPSLAGRAVALARRAAAT